MNKVSAVLNGREVASKLLEVISQEIAELAQTGTVLTLATVRVGDAHDTNFTQRPLRTF